jgi:peptidoglycan/xylan/chitin deacetylase (PgdA/CDA1 family)
MNKQRKWVFIYATMSSLLLLLLIFFSGSNLSSCVFCGPPAAQVIVEAHADSHEPHEADPSTYHSANAVTPPDSGLFVTFAPNHENTGENHQMDISIAQEQPPAKQQIEPPSNVIAMPSPTTPSPAKQQISIPILNYHSVTIDPGNIVAISPEKLSKQMEYLKETGYTPLTLQTFTDIMEGTRDAPDKPVLLTFDDGYIDNYENVLPLLAQLKFPATIFISPGMTEHDGYVNWDHVKKMKEAGWDIQPHGMTHPHLPKLSAEQQAYEILEAKQQIEKQLGTPADVFCYPYGEYNKATLKILQDNGFRYAFTIQQGHATDKQSPFLLKRLFVNGEESLDAFIRKLK